MKAVVILDSANRDRLQATRYYADRSLNAPRKFRAELRKVLRRIQTAPTQFPLVQGSYRRAMMAGFPYSVIFEELESSLEVSAIFHTSRMPDTWLRNQ